jgi:hypothetical protein
MLSDFTDVSNTTNHEGHEVTRRKNNLEQKKFNVPKGFTLRGT